MGKKTIILSGIILLALALRLVFLNQSFWLDEAAQVLESKRPLTEQFSIVSDFHPPGFHLLLHFWMMAGSNEIWIRLLPVLLGVGSIFLVFLLGKALLGEKAGLLAAFFLAIGPYHLWYSQEARPYMLFVFFSVLSTWLLVSRRWVWYAVSVAVLLYSLYFAPFLLIAHIVAAAMWYRNDRWKMAAGLFAGSFLFFPWIPSFLSQLKVGSSGIFSGWTSVVSVDPVKTIPLTFAKFIFGRGSIENNILYGLVIFPVFALFLFSCLSLHRKKEGKKLLVFFFIPFLSAIAASFAVPVVAPQRLIFLLPFFYLLLAGGVISLRGRAKDAALIAVIVISIAGVIQYYTDEAVKREQWRQSVAYIETQEKTPALAVFLFPDPFAPWQWYSKGKVDAIGIAPRFIVEDADLLRLVSVADNYGRIYLFQYLSGLTDPQESTRAYLGSHGYAEADIRNFPGVGFIYVFESRNKNQESRE